ncbi:MAG: hypothetical protein KC468_09845, partial [Myxococcales bacterium]|nr:hypothetical protein [Myxococcales bacterium]
FSSAKDGDRTKIGKFGIGFVSVFAIEPKAVCVDTSREGEHWRVIFNEQREFSLRRREEPVDGTKITLLKPMTRGDFKRFRERAREVVKFWCRHVPGEIRFDDEVITGPLDLDLPCKTRVRHDALELVVAHAEGDEGFSGYYNSGLTLAEGRGEEGLESIAFKASSPNIEHTLTRDDIIRDAGFHRVVEQVHEAVHGPLCAEVFEMLEEHVAHAAHEGLTEYLYRAASWHVQRRRPLPPAARERTVARSPSGARVSLAALLKALVGGDVFIAGARSPTTDALEAAGEVVVLVPAEEPGEDAGDEDVAQVEEQPVRTFLSAASKRAGGHVSHVRDRFCKPLPPADDREGARWRDLRSAATQLMRDYGARISDVQLAHFDYPESAIKDRVAISQREACALEPLADVRVIGMSFFSRRRALLINADHPMVATLTELARSEPEFAAYQLVKLFFLGERLDAALDALLAKHTMERRCQRLKS